MEHGISPALNVQAILRKSPQSPPMIPRKTAVFAAILNTNSVRTRFIVSVLSNTSRAALGFASGVLVARALAPSNYGELTFLLGSFVALLALLDMGTSATFYTLISQRPRPRQFYIVYFVWQGLQFLVAAIFLAWLCPDSFLNTIWLGHSRSMVVLAFVAAFAQQQLWQIISQIGEGSRQSVRVQAMNCSIALVHLIVVGVFISLGILSILTLLSIIIAEYALATLLSYWLLRQSSVEAIDTLPPNLRATLQFYWEYCRPLALLAVITFAYYFADRWLLQRFGGGAEQGFYQISAQFAAVALLATTSILRIFWKEIAEAQARHDDAAARRLHRKVFRGLVMVSTVLAGLLMPWSRNLVALCLGHEFSRAAPVLSIMLLYPVFQTMNQINGTALLAFGYSTTYTVTSSIVMVVSIPITYLALAPGDASPVPGLAGGAMGMAIKMVGLGLLSAHLIDWILARKNRWHFDWTFPFVAIGAPLLIGYTTHEIVSVIWPIPIEGLPCFIFPFLCGGVLYGACLSALLWYCPALIGIDKSELNRFADIVCLRAPFPGLSDSS